MALGTLPPNPNNTYHSVRGRIPLIKSDPVLYAEWFPICKEWIETRTPSKTFKRTHYKRQEHSNRILVTLNSLPKSVRAGLLGKQPGSYVANFAGMLNRFMCREFDTTLTLSDLGVSICLERIDDWDQTHPDAVKYFYEGLGISIRYDLPE